MVERICSRLQSIIAAWTAGMVRFGKVPDPHKEMYIRGKALVLEQIPQHMPERSAEAILFMSAAVKVLVEGGADKDALFAASEPVRTAIASRPPSVQAVSSAVAVASADIGARVYQLLISKGDLHAWVRLLVDTSLQRQGCLWSSLLKEARGVVFAQPDEGALRTRTLSLSFAWRSVLQTLFTDMEWGVSRGVPIGGEEEGVLPSPPTGFGLEDGALPYLNLLPAVSFIPDSKVPFGLTLSVDMPSLPSLLLDRHLPFFSSVFRLLWALRCAKESLQGAYMALVSSGRGVQQYEREESGQGRDMGGVRSGMVFRCFSALGLLGRIETRVETSLTPHLSALSSDLEACTDFHAAQAAVCLFATRVSRALDLSGQSLPALLKAGVELGTLLKTGVSEGVLDPHAVGSVMGSDGVALFLSSYHSKHKSWDECARAIPDKWGITAQTD
ncbi:hypothetical protein KIPB_010458 [Kipferlia bialata]|uniref:Uncharacterized protein n=1 Tax=Kipferlia bialata TaxID=797122 RepID=A0A9K3D574_9EUKA|nr:hypothetical protein KIPB_010458 [Kipferlia bialata]|eukprot:g10458.t1